MNARTFLLTSFLAIAPAPFAREKPPVTQPKPKKPKAKEMPKPSKDDCRMENGVMNCNPRG